MSERLAHDQLSEFLKVNNILTSSQAAFRKLYSTTTSLISSTDHWHENVDNNKMNLAIFLDLRKAFDTVDHNILIKKLNSYGISDRAGDWFESYLKKQNTVLYIEWEQVQTEESQMRYTSGFLFRPLSIYNLPK